MMNFSNYLKFLSIVASLALLSIVGFNRLIDPFALYGGPLIEGVNIHKTAFSRDTRMSKAAAIYQQNPLAIVLGSSRSEQGIDPSHLGWRVNPVYNLSLSGANLYEIFRYLQHAQAIQSLKKVVLTLDFFMFNASRIDVNKNNFREDRLAVNAEGQPNPLSWNDLLLTLFSLDTLVDSIGTVTEQSVATNKSQYIAGFHKIRSYGVKSIYNKGQRQGFLNTEESYFNGKYDQFSFRTPRRDNWKIYQRLLLLSQQQGIDLRIVISPAHARLFETIESKGVWDLFEQWKQQLVALNESVAAQQGKPSFPLWDFSGYNHYTTEEVPALGDAETQMQWYWESSHYKKKLGDLVLDQIFDYHPQERKIADGFGVKITSENITTHLAKIRQDRQQWRASHPEDVMEIAALKK
jgi:hypothetical protein